MEMKIKSMFIYFVILSMSGNSFGQNKQNPQTVFPRGISINYGIGSYSVRDEYISKEKYSGTLPGLGVHWSRFHNKYGYRLDLEYKSSSKIRNYNVSADIIQFSLHQHFMYPTRKFTMFSKEAYWFLGPSMELYMYYNKQNVATEGINVSFSFATLFSVGAYSALIVPIRHYLQAESSIGLSLLSLGIRMIDIEAAKEDEEVSPLKFLTAFSGTNASSSLGIRFFLLKRFSLKLAYKLQITRISSWDYLIAASDNVIATFTYQF